MKVKANLDLQNQPLANMAQASAGTDATNLAQVQSLIAGGGSGGDVVGPASSTPNALSAFSDGTGKALKNTDVIVDANNNLATPGNFSFGGNSGSLVGQIITDNTGITITCPSAANSQITLTPTGDGNVGINGDFGVAGGSSFTGSVQLVTGGGLTLPTYVAGLAGMIGSGSFNSSGVCTITTQDCTVNSFPFTQKMDAVGNLNITALNNGSFTVTSTSGASDSGKTFLWVLFNANT